jgi:hypothetical protein
MAMSVVALDIHGNPDPTGAAMSITGGHLINGVDTAATITANAATAAAATAAEATARIAAIAALPTFYPTMPFHTTAIAYAVLSTDYFVIATASPGIPTFPTAVGITGRAYIFKNNSGSSITPVTTSSQTIDGSVPAAVTNHSTLRLVSDGANWQTW